MIEKGGVMYEAFNFLSLRQLGTIYGVSSHKVGRWLKEIGLSTATGEPTQDAIDAKFCELVVLDDGAVFWAWSREKVAGVLEQHGLRPSTPASSATTEKSSFSGPFEFRLSGSNTWEIICGDGSVCVWVLGEDRARKVSVLLNLACKHGKL